MEKPDTLPKHFMEKVAHYGESKVAIRQKDLGIWQEYTWQDSCEQVRNLTLGLVALGLERGDKISIVGDNDRQYIWADLAIMAAGGVTVGIFTDANPSEMEYVIVHSESRFAFAKDQEQCDKHLEIKENIPNIQKVIYWEPRGMWNYDDPWLISYDEVSRLGVQLHEQQPHLFDELVAKGAGDDLANLCYTSGTTGLPKGAMLTHDIFLSAVETFHLLEPRQDTDNVLSFTPLAWIAEHTLAVTPHVMYGVIVNFPEAPETIQQNIREIAPDFLFYPSRLWENLTAIIQVRINDSAWINRFLYKLFLPIGYKVADLRYEKKPASPWLTFLYWLGEFFVFRPLRGQLGLTKIRTAITAGASLSPDMLRFFRALGINLKQVYSSTETAAAGTQHRDDDVKFASVGTPLPNIEFKISTDGEILVGGKNIFTGYYKNEEATALSLSVDEKGTRWFHTGDAGYIDDDGHLIYLDRVKDMITLSSGDKYSPQYLEGRLKFSPYIQHAMAIGAEDKEYVTTLINIDFDNVGRWAEKKGITYTTFLDLSQKQEVYRLIQEDVERVNSSLPPGARIRKFVLMHKEFDADEAEMTRTRKLRRGLLAERYQEIIDAMYDGREECKVSAVVRYRDGRTSSIETMVHIASLESEENPA
ncbi:MAG: long-chain fatty acid--CoA ligase [Chloroflexi bacterium]|nr:long-chain fatty acid--CoA ligase [Chloroflexota bacterium]